MWRFPLFAVACVHASRSVRTPQALPKSPSSIRLPPDVVHMAMSACQGARGQQVAKEVVVMANSVAVAASEGREYHIHIFVDDGMKTTLKPWLDEGAKALVASGVHIHIQDADTSSKHINTFRKCATERARLPVSLAEVDSVLYSDSDTIWQEDPAVIWRYFSKFTPEQTMAMSVETELKAAASRLKPDQPWILDSFKKDLPWGVNGFNTGILMWNLTRARKTNDMDKIIKTLDLLQANYTKFFRLGDQDALNLMALENPSQFMVLPCKYNLHVNSLCYEMPKLADTTILHGNCALFHQGRQYLGGRDYRLLFEDFYRWSPSEPFTASKCCSLLKGTAWPPTAKQPSTETEMNVACDEAAAKACKAEV